MRTAIDTRSAVAAQAGLESAMSARVRAIRTEGEFRLWETPGGALWMPADSDWLVPHLLAEDARQVYGSPVCRPGDVVLDCGAHVGVFTREAVRSGASLVIAIEPGPENLTCLRRNLDSEIAAGVVRIVPEGVWDHEDEMFITHVAGNSANDYLSATQQGGTSVRLTTIDSIVSEAGLFRVDVIKMDIEGAERMALMGARETLSKLRPRLAVASYHHPDDPEAIRSIVLGANSAYKIRCGACATWFGSRRIVPEILFFE